MKSTDINSSPYKRVLGAWTPTNRRFRIPFRTKAIGTEERVNPGLFNFIKFKTAKESPVDRSGTMHASVSDDMDWRRQVSNNHTDLAYRDAVSRLRTILGAGTGNPQPLKEAPDADENIKPRAIASVRPSSASSPRGKISEHLKNLFGKEINKNEMTGYKVYPMSQDYGASATSSGYEDDLFRFIDKQGEYISQLEKETKYCRGELGDMLERVREVINENEALHEKQKKDIFTSMINELDKKTGAEKKSTSPRRHGATSGGGGSVLMESKIAQLEAELSQAKRECQQAYKEITDLKFNQTVTGNDIPAAIPVDKAGTTCGLSDALTQVQCDIHRAEICSLMSEKEELIGTMTKLKKMIKDLRDRESDAAKKVKSSIEIVEQMQMEKAQTDIETKRLKDEVERYQTRLKEMIQDHSKRIHDEKLMLEKKYRQELDNLNNEMSHEMDELTRVKLDLERQKRLEMDLRREIQQKNCLVDDMKQELTIKMTHLQNELGQALSSRGGLEQDLINSRLKIEKLERDARQEALKLEAEISGLRKRLEQADQDSLKHQETISLLNETIISLRKQVPITSEMGKAQENSDIPSILKGMEEKHKEDMNELENLIQAQNELLDKMRGECKLLTDKLEETSRDYKKDRKSLLQDRDRLWHLGKKAQEKCCDLEQKLLYYSSSHNKMTDRLQKLEIDDKARSERIYQLLSKQGELLKENQRLQNEMEKLRRDDLKGCLDNRGLK